jgi:hypothetical protein
MTGTILFDGHNLMVRNATGIGAYTRELAAAARRLGYDAQLLIGGNVPFNRKDPQLSEVLLFDARLEKKPPPRVRAERLIAKAIGKPFGIRPVQNIPAPEPSGRVRGKASPALRKPMSRQACSNWRRRIFVATAGARRFNLKRLRRCCT